MQDKKNKEQRNKTLKAAGLLIATAVVAVMVYKSSGWKNMLKGHFGELWERSFFYIFFIINIFLHFKWKV